MLARGLTAATNIYRGRTSTNIPQLVFSGVIVASNYRSADDGGEGTYNGPEVSTVNTVPFY